MREVSLLYLWGFFTFLAVTAARAETCIDHHSYRQTNGRETLQMEWQLLSRAPLQLKTKLGSEEDLTTVDSALATRSWLFFDPEKGTEIRAERRKNLLKITGRLRGELIDHQIKLDVAPWYQTLSLSLGKLLQSEQKSEEFWILRPDTLKVYKLRAVKNTIEELEVLGQRVAAVKVEICVVSLGSLLWKAHYWFRVGDFLFVRYAGPSGLPGTSKTIVDLLW